MNDTQALMASPSHRAGNESLAMVVDELARRFEEGEAVEIDAFLVRYAQHEAALRQLWPAIAALAEFGNSNGAALALDPLAGATDEAGRLGDFRIVREIGRGGMGVVYEAEQISLGRRVALKVLPFAGVLDERQLKRFKLEAAAAAALKHPNIVSVYCVGCERGVHFYAMEYVEGQTLAAAILECGNLLPLSFSDDDVPPQSADDKRAAIEIQSCDKSQHSKDTVAAALSTLRETKPGDFYRRVAELGIQAADALEHAHQMGIVHRDIKPANLLLDREGKLYITDFGLARLSTDAGMTMTGDLLGTLRYMSPEQAAGAKLLDERTDIYSLGITLYELATGKPAFPETERQKLIRQVTEDEPQRLRAIDSRIPADLETVIGKAIAKEPDDRFSAAKELAADLRRFLADQPISARRVPLTTRIQRWGRRHVGAVMSLVIFLAVSLAGLGVALALIFNEQRKTADALEQAEANLDIAAEAVDKLYANFAVEWVANESAPSNVQQAFLRSAADFYRRILDRSGDTAQDRLKRATAYDRIGQLETYLENYEEALPALERAAEIGRKLHQEFPGEESYREALSDTLYNLGLVHRGLNQLENADAAFREALELRQSLSSGWENADREIGILLEYAKVLRQRNELDHARRLADEARTKASQLAEQSATSDTWRLRYIDCRFVMAGILLDQGHLQEAATVNEQALGQCQYLRVHALADYRPLLQAEAHLTGQSARIAVLRGEFPVAIAKYRTALDLLRQGFKAKRSPAELTTDSMARKVRDDGNWESGPFCSYIELQLQLADVLRRAGRPHEAEVELGSCVLTGVLLVTIKPNVLRYEVAYANAWAMVGQLIAADRPEESKSAYRIAARYWLAAIERDPDAALFRSGVPTGLTDFEYFQKLFPGDLAKNAATAREWSNAMGDNVFAHHARATAWFHGEAWHDSLYFAEKAANLRKKDRAYDWLYMAMNHAHLGKPGIAQKWYDKSAQEIEANGQPSAELLELLDIAGRLIEEKRKTAGPPAITIVDVTTSESAKAVLNATLSDACATPVTVDFATADGTALAGVDYEPANGRLTFAPYETSQAISISTIQDSEFEEAETFAVRLSNLSAGVLIGKADATVTIAKSDMPQVGLVSHWTADNTGDDAKGANHATLISGATYVAGQVGQAFSFDGVDDRVQVSDSPSLAFTESMTIEGWIRIASLPSKTNQGQILFRGDDRGGLDPYSLFINPHGLLIFRIHSGANEAAAIQSVVPVGRFIYVAATLDDTTGVMRLYVNGALVTEKITAIRPFGKLDFASNPGIGIGNHGGHPASIHNFPFHGQIDELKVYDKALSAEEVANHFQTEKNGRSSSVAQRPRGAKFNRQVRKPPENER